MKRAEMIDRDQQPVEENQLENFEQSILLGSVCDTVVPKLIQEDIPLLQTLLSGVFPGAKIPEIKEHNLRQEISNVCKKRNYQTYPNFVEKILQIF
jgi:dynein heavy chain 1